MRSSYSHVPYFLWRRRWYMHIFAQILNVLYLSNYPINSKTWLIIVSGEQLFGQQYTKPSIKGTIYGLSKNLTALCTTGNFLSLLKTLNPSDTHISTLVATCMARYLLISIQSNFKPWISFHRKTTTN